MAKAAALAIAIAVSLISCKPQAITSAPKTGFRTSDGFLLEGRVFGEGRRAIVLAHMRPSDQKSWFDFAEALAEKRYLVLTFNFRGYGDSQGETDLGVLDRDVEAAVAHLSARHGAESVVLVGASMGGTASLVAASRIEVAGVVSLSPPARIDGLDALGAVGRVSEPKLFIAANDDGSAAESAELLYRATLDPRELKIVPGSDHGTDLLTGDSSAEVVRLVEAFIAEVLGG